MKRCQERSPWSRQPHAPDDITQAVFLLTTVRNEKSPALQGSCYVQIEILGKVLGIAQVSDNPVLTALPLGLGPLELLGLDQVEQGSIRPAAAPLTDPVFVDLRSDR